MKKIHLLRHAKSSWGDVSLQDFDRPLNTRGIRTAKLMALKLVESNCSFTNVFCSPAIRAVSTMSLISEQLTERNINWKTDKALYTFDSTCLHAWFQSLNESISELLIVGHNPALTYFCNELSSCGVDYIPTCGYVQLVSKNQCSWSKISETPFEVKAFLKTKSLINLN